MISFRATMTLPLFGLLVALAGCSAESGNNAGAESANAALSENADTTAPSAHHGRRGHHGHFGHRPHGGSGFLVGAALHESIGLTSEQQSTIAGLRDEAPQEALSKLHATLTKEQRSALVEAVSKRMDTMRAKAAENGGERHGKMHGPPHGHGDHSPMGRLLEGLDVTDAQHAAIRSKLEELKPSAEQREAMKAKFSEVETEMKARLQTFVNDDFDAKTFFAPPKNLPERGEGFDPMKQRIDAVMSVLEPAQREKLKARLEEARAGRHERPEFGRRGGPR